MSIPEHFHPRLLSFSRRAIPKAEHGSRHRLPRSWVRPEGSAPLHLRATHPPNQSFPGPRMLRSRSFGCAETVWRFMTIWRGLPQDGASRGEMNRKPQTCNNGIQLPRNPYKPMKTALCFSRIIRPYMSLIPRRATRATTIFATKLYRRGPTRIRR